MNLTTNLRKNKSLKQIQPENSRSLKYNKKFHKQAPNNHHSLTNQHSKAKQYTLSSAVVLQPLPTQNYLKESFKKHTINRMEFTQSLSNQHTLSKLDFRYEKQSSKYEKKQETNLGTLGKENRPCSMNELKYPKINGLERNDKYESHKMLPINKKERGGAQETAQGRLMKTYSRTRLIALEHTAKIKTDSQVSSSQKALKGFRKAILEQIFNKPKTKNIDQPSKNSPEISKHEEQLKNTNKFVQFPIILDQALTIESSPVAKEDNLFGFNCSTIQQRSQNNSKFLGDQTMRDFMVADELEASNFWKERQTDRRKKAEMDKLKRKFPDNFFK